MNQNIHDALTIGIPTAAVLFEILSTLLVNNRRFDRSDEQLKSLRLDMNRGFDQADEQLKSLLADTSQGFEVVHTDLERIYELTGDLKEKHGELKGRVDTIEKRIS